ncbi:hypothetical protein Cgig2_023137 [Carnegiea gigantea]|uniref:Uncharacterized protein n=1 Tax=Carnegiea gigantea TaxID=171969 RepID=A0A9Q1GLL2_9CARY|nr:hypothetical protein Cgig2_023137 [Carnegiea gigantea]
MELGKGNEPTRKSAAKGEENKQSSEQTVAKNALSEDEGRQKSPKKHEDIEKHIQKALTKREKKEKREKKGYVSNVELSNNFDAEENDLAYERKHIDHDDGQIEAEEEVAIYETVKPAQKRSKHSLQSKGNGVALVLMKPTSSGKDLQFVLVIRALKLEEGASENRTYQKAFITTMTMCLFSSVVAQLNEGQAEAVRSMGLLDRQKFPVTAFNVYVTLGMPFGGREITEITESSTDEEYDEVCAAWLKEWKIEQNASELTQMSEFILAKGDGVSNDSRAPPPNSQDQIPRTALVADASVTTEKEDQREHVVLDQSNNVMKKDDSIALYSLGLGLSQP